MLEKRRKNTLSQDGEDAMQKRKKEEDEKRNTMTEVEFLKWLHG